MLPSPGPLYEPAPSPGHVPTTEPSEPDGRDGKETLEDSRCLMRNGRGKRSLGWGPRVGRGELLRYRVKGQRRQLRRKGRAGEQWAQRMNPKGLPVFPGSGAGPLPGAPMLE